MMSLHLPRYKSNYRRPLAEGEVATEKITIILQNEFLWKNLVTSKLRHDQFSVF